MSSYRILTFSGSDPAIAPYRPMIYSDFMRSLRYGNAWYKLIDPSAYYPVYRAVIDQLLARRNAQVRLACLSDDLDTCLGWSLTEGDCLHYVFVKLHQRRQGIGAALVPDPVQRVSHLTKIGQAIREKHLPQVIFNPFL